MTWWQAALWGLAGGGAASVASLSASVAGAGYTWPWREQGTLGPRLFVITAGLVLGAVVDAAAASQISGPWPAFILGIGAPATVRGVLSGVEVTPRTDPPPDEAAPIGPTAHPAPHQRQRPHTAGQEVAREDAP